MAFLRADLSDQELVIRRLKAVFSCSVLIFGTLRNHLGNYSGFYINAGTREEPGLGVLTTAAETTKTVPDSPNRTFLQVVGPLNPEP